MKSLLLSTILLFAAASMVWAREISSDEAGRAAAAWVRRDNAPLGAALASAKVSEVRTAAGEDGTPLFHVVRMSGGGVVVTSAESGVTPVVAFLDGDDIEEAAGNPLWDILNADMAERTAYVAAVRAEQGTKGTRLLGAAASSADPFAAAEAAWEDLLAEGEKSAVKGSARSSSDSIDDASGLSDLRVAPLLATAWAQRGNAANYYTPPGAAGDPDNYACGCSALACAQIANYWRFPAESMPPVTNLCYVSSEPSYYVSKGGTYDWANMPTDFSALTDEQKRAVGHLCYDFGVAAMMNWGPDGSGTGVTILDKAFREVFGYASAATYVYYTGGNMPDELVERSILANLDAKRPVIIEIYMHAAVADGYGYCSGTLYTHVNCGWGGVANAWYNLPYVNANNYDVDYISSMLIGVVYNIHPTETDELLTGRVLDENGDPVCGASVTATNGFCTATATTDEKGIYALRVPGGRNWTVSATDPDSSQSGSCHAYAGLTISSVFAARTPERVLAWTDESSIGNSWGNDITLGVDLLLPSFSDALDAPALEFTTGGDVDWLVSTTGAHDGEDVAQSCHKNGEMSTWLETTVAGPGTFSFWWNVSSEEGYDWLEFYVDGMLDSRISGTNAVWTLKEVEIQGGGVHTLRWRYVKDEFTSNGADCGWVDQVTWTPSGDIFVDAATGSDANDGLSLATAKVTIQAAIDVVEAGAATNAVVIVNDGRYEPIVATNNIPFLICSLHGPDAAIIDGSLQWERGVTNRCATLGSANSHTNTILSSFTLTNGVERYGGGAYCGKLKSCLVAGNTAISSGGGAYRTALEDCVVSGNSANYGGGLYMGSANLCTIAANAATASGGGASSTGLTRCVVTNNTAVSFGGGAYIGTLVLCNVSDNSANSGGGTYGAALTDCTVACNVATNYGGGVNGGSATRCGIVRNRVIVNSGGGSYGAALANCVVVYNSAEAQYGGGAYGGALTNCTVFANSASIGGGVDYASLVNCIVWGNEADTNPNVRAYNDKPCLCSCLGEALSGEMHVGNIVADPLFLDGVHGYYDLQANSPCINAGADDLVAGETDFYARIVGRHVDMGASELQATDYPSWATVWEIVGAADYVTEGQYNLIRYVFDRPTGACEPFTGISFDAQGMPSIHTLVPVNVEGLSVKLFATEDLSDWSDSKLIELMYDGPTRVWRTIDNTVRPAMFFKLHVGFKGK